MKKEVDQKNGWITKLCGKTEDSSGVVVQIPISWEFEEQVFARLLEPLRPDDPWFKEVAVDNCLKRFERAFTRAGLKGHSFKTFRNQGVIHLINIETEEYPNNVLIDMIQKLMGHKHISTTMIYAKCKRKKIEKTRSALDWNLKAAEST